MSDPKPNCESLFDGKVRAWTKGVPFDEKAQEQVGRVASLPFVQPVAIMPDVHWGMGATIGSVIPTLGAIIPAAVGVDIGCGMVACKTNINPNSLTRLSELRSQIEEAVPHGRTDNGGANDVGAWGDLPAETATAWKAMSERYDRITEKHPGGVECRKDASVLDESPAAYKDIDAVMAAQSDLVKVRHTLRQIICVKG